eukprot:7887931-Karenia_brevis.AAC.1
MYNNPVTLQPVARPTVVMPYPMSNVTPVPSSSRGVTRPASRELPAPCPQQVPRSRLLPAYNNREPKQPPPVDHARLQLEAPTAPPQPVEAAAASLAST